MQACVDPSLSRKETGALGERKDAENKILMASGWVFPGEVQHLGSNIEKVHLLPFLKMPRWLSEGTNIPYLLLERATKRVMGQSRPAKASLNVRGSQGLNGRMAGDGGVG